MNTRNLPVVVAMAAMLIGGGALASTNIAFAGNHRKHNQEQSQTEDCGNGKFPFNALCQELAGNLNGDGSALIVPGGTDRW